MEEFDVSKNVYLYSEEQMWVGQKASTTFDEQH